jgi:hypothetical protein
MKKKNVECSRTVYFVSKGCETNGGDASASIDCGGIPEDSTSIEARVGVERDLPSVDLPQEPGTYHDVHGAQGVSFFLFQTFRRLYVQISISVFLQDYEWSSYLC